MDQYHYQFRYYLVGDCDVGKSCLMTKFTTKEFKQEYFPTAGIEFGTGFAQIADKSIKLQIWVTTGLESQRQLARSCYYSSIGVYFVFDLTNKQSFENILTWYNEIKIIMNEYSHLNLIGNKLDLEQNRQVTREEAEKFAQEYKMHYYETSAKTGQNIIQIFEEVAQGIVEKIDTKDIDPSQHIIKQLQQTYGIQLGECQESEKQEENPSLEQ